MTYVVPSKREIVERRARHQRHFSVERDNAASASSSDDEESGRAIDLLKTVEKDMAVNQENVREAERLIEEARRNRHSRRGGSERSAGDEQAGPGPVPPVGDSSDSEVDIKEAGGGAGPGSDEAGDGAVPERDEEGDGAVPERGEEGDGAVPKRDEEGAGTVYQSDEDRDEEGAGTVYQSDEDRDEDSAEGAPDASDIGPVDNASGGEKESTGDGDGIPVAGDDTGRSRDEVKWIMLRAALKRSSENLVNENLPSQTTLTKQGIAGLLTFIVPVLMSRLELADEDQKDREIESLTSFIHKWETRSAGWKFWSRLEIR